MNKKILIVCLFLLSISPLFLDQISAEQQTLGTFKQGSCIELMQTCSNCTYNNISSVLYPNSTIAISSRQMTKTDTKYNYSYCYTNISGEYIVNGFGDPDAVKTVWAYGFTINPTGIPASEMRTQTTTRTIYIVFAMALLCFFAFLYVKHTVGKWSLFIVACTFVVVTINLIGSTLINEVLDEGLINFFDALSAVSFYFYWFAGGMLIIIWTLSIFNTMWSLYGKRNYDKFGGQEGGKYG